jgi:hypothetical protein
MTMESIFTWGAPPLKFGPGAVADIPDLVPGTMNQQRLLATCARPVTDEDIAGIFARSIQNW